MTKKKQKITKEPDKFRIISTPMFTLKDKVNKQFQFINLKNQFGFDPKVVIVEKVKGKNNTIIIRAVITNEELEARNKLIAEIVDGAVKE